MIEATVAVYVEDQQKALEFWTEKVGFTVVAKDSDEHKASIVFECDNMQETYERLKSNGVEFIEEPKTMQWGTYAQFKDVDGNEFLLKG